MVQNQQVMSLFLTVLPWDQIYQGGAWGSIWYLCFQNLWFTPLAGLFAVMLAVGPHYDFVWRICASVLTYQVFVQHIHTCAPITPFWLALWGYYRRWLMILRTPATICSIPFGWPFEAVIGSVWTFPADIRPCSSWPFGTLFLCFFLFLLPLFWLALCGCYNWLL